VLLGVLFLAMIYVAINLESVILQITSYGLIFASIFIIVTLSVNECFRDSSKKFIKFNKTVKLELDSFFEGVNLVQREVGVQWAVNEGHYWLECRINRNLERMKTTPTQGFFATDGPLITETEQNLRNLISNGSSKPTMKPISRGSEPEKEDQLTPRSQMKSQIESQKNNRESLI